MTKTILIVALTALPLVLSGCEKKPDAPKAEASTDSMGNMAMPEGSKMGKGSGTVTAIDATAGQITLDHGAIPAVGWSAMTMGFSAKPELLRGIAVGDKVTFDVAVTGSTGEVTAISKR